MKRILLFSWVVVLLFSACEKDTDTLAPNERPDARLNKVLADYKELLTGAEWGWKATLYPDGGSRYSFMFTFTENDRVKMLSDISAATATESYESTYRLRAMQRPSLLFDTYSYLHILADPDERKSGGVRGEGRFSDFEFNFQSATESRIELVGNYNGSKLVLEKATQEEAENYMEELASTIAAFEKINSYSTFFKRVNLGNTVFDIDANTNTRTITFYYYDGYIQRMFQTEYYYGKDGVILENPFSIGGLTISALNNVAFSAISNEVSFTVNNSRTAVKEAEAPIKIDPAAGRKFFNNPPNGRYAISVSGFTVENKEDAFDLFSIENYYFLVYWPQFSDLPEFGGSKEKPVDLFGFILINREAQSVEIGYGPALITEPTTDGRVIFTKAGEFGETPEQAKPMVDATVQQLLIPEGYYVIQTEEGGFVLVSAKDAKAWISFF